MEIIEIGSRPNPTIIFQCSVCKSVFSANVNELETVGFSSTNDIMYRFMCPVCGMKRYAMNCKENKND